MTLTTAALNVLSAIQSGSLEPAESYLQQLNNAITQDGEHPSLASVLSILQEARMALSDHRAHIVNSLQQLENSCLYSQPAPAPGISWELAG